MSHTDFNFCGSTHRNMSSSTDQSSLIDFILPDIGEGISEVVVKGWLVKVGDSVQEFDQICEVESDKATVTISSRYNGIVRKLLCDEGATAKVGKPLLIIELGEDGSRHSNEGKENVQTNNDNDPVKPLNNSNSSSVEPKAGSIIPTLPSVRRLASQNNIDLSKVVPTGKDGRVLKEDLLDYMQNLDKSTQIQMSRDHEYSNLPNDSLKSNKTELHQFSSIQNAMFKTMSEALKIPHFQYSDEMNVSQLINGPLINKNKLNKSVLEDRMSLLSIIIKLTSLSLLKYPQLNASIDEQNKQLIIKKYHNIGVAVDTKSGLLVPNIKNVEQLSIRQINNELIRLRELGYSSKLSLSDLSGGTFTLSNIGSIGGIFGIPVIMPPEIVIGALGKTRKLPRYRSNDDELEMQHILQVVWSADHRIVDGATLSRFSNLLKSMLENPESALVDLI